MCSLGQEPLSSFVFLVIINVIHGLKSPHSIRNQACTKTTSLGTSLVSYSLVGRPEFFLQWNPSKADTIETTALRPEYLGIHNLGFVVYF